MAKVNESDKILYFVYYITSGRVDLLLFSFA